MSTNKSTGGPPRTEDVAFDILADSAPRPQMDDYTGLADRLRQLGAWIDTAYRHLRSLEVGSDEGLHLARTIQRVENERKQVRRLVLNHPDAPPQG